MRWRNQSKDTTSVMNPGSQGQRIFVAQLPFQLEQNQMLKTVTPIWVVPCAVFINRRSLRIRQTAARRQVHTHRPHVKIWRPEQISRTQLGVMLQTTVLEQQKLVLLPEIGPKRTLKPAKTLPQLRACLAKPVPGKIALVPGDFVAHYRLGNISQNVLNPSAAIDLQSIKILTSLISATCTDKAGTSNNAPNQS